MHESKYGPQWTVSSKSGGNDGGDQCLHLARVTDEIREQYSKQHGGGSLRVGTTHVARDEHGGWLEFTEGEIWAFLRGAREGDFDHLLVTPRPVAEALPGSKMQAAEGWPEGSMLEAAFGLLCSAQPHEVLNAEKALEWSRAFEAWKDAYNRHVSVVTAAAPEWSCSA